MFKITQKFIESHMSIKQNFLDLEIQTFAFGIGTWHENWLNKKILNLVLLNEDIDFC